jgi:hypothetical protein
MPQTTATPVLPVVPWWADTVNVHQLTGVDLLSLLTKQGVANVRFRSTRDGMAKEGRLVGVEREDGSGKSFNLKVHVGWAGNTPVHENVHVRLR